MITLLPQQLISKIAAGEVVERPASVVKELIENALDAHATAITVDIECGGKKLIRVADNGHGISRDDLPRAVQPHATSKISSFDDLYSLATFGFRGEALASIAHVSDLSIKTRGPHAPQAYELMVHEGNAKNPVITPTAAPVGTVVACKNLFARLPARQKFLKSDTAEFSHILDVCTALAFIHHNVHCMLNHNGRTVLTLPPRENFHKRIEEIIGPEIMSSLVPVSFQRENYSLEGFISAPGKGSSKPKYQQVFINRRPVKDFLILKAIKQGMGNRIMEREVPTSIVHMMVNTQKVDVNVHPRKLEVKHQNPHEVFAFVEAAVHRAMNAIPFTAQGSVLEPSTILPRDFSAFPQTSFKKQYSYRDFPKHTELPTRAQTLFAQNRDVFGTHEDQQKNAFLWHILGQIHAAYIVIENEQGLLIVDQHAAAERITFERLKHEQEQNQAVHKQALALPLCIELDPHEYIRFEEARETFDALGFETEPLGNQSINLISVPAALSIRDPGTLFKAILTSLQESERTASTDPLIHKMLMVVACKNSVKFGDILTQEEQQALITTLEKTPNNNTCIHGRPVSYRITLNELARMFKRGGT